jgi:hypothetical protein
MVASASTAQQLCCQSPPRLFLEIDVGELLPGAVLHDERGANILECGKRREMA